MNPGTSHFAETRARLTSFLLFRRASGQGEPPSTTRAPLGRGGRPALLLLLFSLLWLLGGCATYQKTLGFFGLGNQDSRNQSPEYLAMDGIEALNKGDYKGALEHFQQIKERYPFSSVGALADLKAADATFYLRRYDEAYTLYQEFESLHPSNEAIPYVLFQMAMCHYLQIGTVDRDPAAAVKAIAAFRRLNRAFPDSPYREEAQGRIAAALDFLARHEMFVATFYLKTKEYDQAGKRLNYLLETYPQSPTAPKAKELLAAIEAGNPPTRTWRDWLPNVTLGSWSEFIEAISPMPSGMSDSGPR